MPSDKDIVVEAREVLKDHSRIHALNDREPSKDVDVSWLLEGLADEVERLREENHRLYKQAYSED